VEPDFAGAMRVIQDNPVDLDSVGGSSAAAVLRSSGLAHLGLGHVDLALDHLIRAFRIGDRVGHEGNLGNVVFAMAVALAEAGQMTLSWQLIGYAQAHYHDSLMRGYSHLWLQARLANLENTIDMTERASAVEAGARLDRRGFMRLLAEAETSAEQVAGT
jgi:hypothetical protein